MTVGDYLEWLAGALAITAAWLAGGDSAGIGTAAVFAFYEAQVYAGSPLVLRKRSSDGVEG